MDDQRQELHLDDQEEEELGDRYPEVAELGDQMDPSEVVAEGEEQKAQELQELQQLQAQHRPQELEDFAEQRRFVVQEQELEQQLALEQQQEPPYQQVEQK